MSLVEIKTQFIRAFNPNKSLSKKSMLIMTLIQIGVFVLLWLSSGALIPKPIEIIKALKELILYDGLIHEIGSSLNLAFTSLGYTIVLSLSIAYLNVLPIMRPIGFLYSKLRFLTIVGLSFIFTIYTNGGSQLKVTLMIFAMSVFFVPGAINIVNGVTRNSLNHARTLRMNEWEVVYRKQIVGTLDQIFELIRQNFAIAWMMLTMVEGLVRSEGGVGTMLLNQNKHLHLDAVFAIQICILFCGIGLDYFIGVIKNLSCPHSRLVLDRK